MSKHHFNYGKGSTSGFCIACKRRIIGPGDRCSDCQQRLRQRRRRKPR
jgi:hypothetical protein